MSHVSDVRDAYFHDTTVSDAEYGRMIEEASDRDLAESLEDEAAFEAAHS